MDYLNSSVLIPLYFVHVAFGTSILALWFLRQKDRLLKDFGLGMAGYALGSIAWAILVITKPTDLKPLILIGVVPFLLAHLAYAKVASSKLRTSKNTLMTIVLLLIAATFVVRTFIYPSAPYFSSEGLLFFGLNSIASAFYIAIISITFLPAIWTVAPLVKQKALKSTLGIGLTILYIGSIILVSVKDSTLLLINGWAISLALLILWVKTFSAGTKG